MGVIVDGTAALARSIHDVFGVVAHSYDGSVFTPDPRGESEVVTVGMPRVSFPDELASMDGGLHGSGEVVIIVYGADRAATLDLSENIARWLIVAPRSDGFALVSVEGWEETLPQDVDGVIDDGITEVEISATARVNLPSYLDDEALFGILPPSSEVRELELDNRRLEVDSRALRVEE